MMIGPMKKKVITSAVVTGVILTLVFVAVFAIYSNSKNNKIAELEKKGEVVQRYVFAKDMVVGDVVTEADIKVVDVKGESASLDSYVFEEKLDDKGKKVVSRDDKWNIIGKRLKVNAEEKTIITKSLFYTEDQDPEMTTRLQEFNMITLPSDLDAGDYIDVRIRFSTGEDYAVIVGKKVESLGATEEKSNTIFLRLNEEEIVRMSSAIIESYVKGGINLYANKYVDPDNQLFIYNRVNFVEKYENAKYETISVDSLTYESGESGEKGKYIIPDGVTTSGDEFIKERTTKEIASIIGLNEEETENIKIALANKDEDTLSYYKDKLVTGTKSITANYPVRTEVATLIKNNPNILEEIKQKYDIEELEDRRATLLAADYYKYQVDMDGNLVLDYDGNPIRLYDENGNPAYNEDYIKSVDDKLKTEIETQKSERQEYLLGLIQKQRAATTTTEE